MNRAPLVAAGIMISRVAGFVRMRTFAYYFGLRNDSADAFSAAFRIPNLLQFLFGEGALAASFIPVYASLLARGDRREADRVAGAVATVAAAIVSIVVLAGIVATPAIVSIIAPGFHGEKRALTVQITRVLFPGAGMLTLSAWCMGVLNSHNRFTLSYAAPVAWNAAMIATLLMFGGREPLPRLAVLLAWGSVVGSALQLAVQVRSVRQVAPDLRMVIDVASDHVRAVGRNFVPALMSRGVGQVSAYIDALLASLLPTGAVAGLANAQLLYSLPVSLFGISVAATELPAMSAAVDAGDAEVVRQRLHAGLRRIAFFVVPSSAAFLALGDVVAGAVFQTGRFTRGDAVYVWAILAGSSVGLVASTLARLYSSTFYALRDTRTPLIRALVRVFLTTVLGYLFAVPGPSLLGIDRSWGAAGLTASAGIAGWVEMLLLRLTLRSRIGASGPLLGYLGQLWGSAAAATAVAWAIKLALPALHPVTVAALVLVPFGVVYFATALALRLPEASAALARARRLSPF